MRWVLCAWARLQLDVAPDASFAISVFGQQWLAGKDVQVGEWATKDRSLELQGHKVAQGKDVLGAYNATSFTYAAGGDEVLEATFRAYDGGHAVFEQYFPIELELPGKEYDPDGVNAATLFPLFDRAQSPPLQSFAYHSVFPQMISGAWHDYHESHQGGVPLVLHTASEGGPMAVFSPLGNFKAHHMASGDGWAGAGLKASAKLVPAGWRQRWLLTAGKGIRAGMMHWGDLVLKYTGKPRTNLRKGVLDGIGFWTDNGGYYHYATGSNETYEEVLPKVKKSHDEAKVPFQHWQFDSWFYPKDGGVNPGGGGGAVTNWTALPSVFPSGMAAIQKKIGLPIVMHNRQWSTHSDYIKHEPFEWYIDAKAAVPKDPPGFFKWFFTQQQGWGLAMYEQDWMCTEYDEVGALRANLSLADLWLEGMASGAQGSGRDVQYCMPYAHDVLAAAALPAVTNARATGDYFHTYLPTGEKGQWNVGHTALFYWAIGVLPSKDGFYSSSKPQVGGQTVGPEPRPDREALMATLSGAFVGPMDGIGLLNASRVMQTCRQDGTVLKPDYPVLPVESCFTTASPEKCYTYRTESCFAAYGCVQYVFSAEASKALSASDLGLEAPAVVYNWYTKALALVAPVQLLAAGYEGQVYAIVAPVEGGWAFLGEVGKFVTAASVRFSVAVSGGRLEARVNGLAGEEVEACAASLAPLRLHCNTVRLDQSGTGVVEFGPSAVVV